MRSIIRVALPASCLVLAGLMAACGGSGSNSTTPPTSQTPPPDPAIAPASVTANAHSLNVSASGSQAGPVGTIELTLANITSNEVFLYGEHSNRSIDRVTAQATSPSKMTLRFYFRAPAALGNGTHSDLIHIAACRDEDCYQMLSGAPLEISSSYVVSGVSSGTDPGAPSTPADPVGEVLEPKRRTALPHNVRDAEYSRALDRLVMVASSPVPALHVLDVVTGTTQSVTLVKTPTAVSISPDGQTAAVGHDALISIVDLTQVGNPDAPAPRLLDVSADVYDLVLDGRGSVHVVPRVDQWVTTHSVHVATNVETMSGHSLRAASRARLHPSGDYFYAANQGLSPSDIEKWDLRSGTATRLYDSPYHGQYGMCGNLWFNESGSRIFTRCGNSFSADAEPELDMRYTGKLELSTNDQNSTPYNVEWMEHHAGLDELAVIESSMACDPQRHALTCFHHLVTLDAQFLGRRDIRSIAPIGVAGKDYPQWGMFVFYRANGEKVMISRLLAVPDPAAEYYVSVL